MDDFVDRKVLRNVLYESDTLTLEGLGILNRFPAAEVITIDKAAGIINKLFGNEPPCNFNGIDEWLGEVCENEHVKCPCHENTTEGWKTLLLCMLDGRDDLIDKTFLK